MDKPLREYLKAVEREVVTQALQTARSAKAAAADLGLSYPALRHVAKKHGMSLTQFHRK